MQVRRSVAGIEWQVVAAVGTVDEALAKMRALHAAVLVVDATTPGADGLAWPGRDAAHLVTIGAVAGADAVVSPDRLDLLRPTVARALHDGGHHSH